MKSGKLHFMCVATLCVTALLASLQAPAQGTFDENAAIGVISGDASPIDKETACRGLRQSGTVASIPALAAMLPNPELSHMARYALEVMPFPEAGQALRDAVARTEGACKAGVIISLGARRDKDAVPDVAIALRNADADVAQAAAGALGRIGTPEAVDALEGYRTDAPATVKPALAEGLLAAAEHLAKDGARDRAAAVYNGLLDPAWPLYVRMGAFRGAAYARPEAAPEHLMKALSGDEPQFRDLAAQIVAEAPDLGATSFYAEALPALSPAGQAALLRGLAGRKDPSARPAVAQALQSADADVKLAAVKALGVIGGAEDVPTLTGLLASDDAETAAAANDSLMSMQNKDADAAIAGVVPGAAPALRAQLLELMANRRSEQVVPLAVANLKDADASVRSSALGVIALLGQQEQFADVLAAVAAATDSSERSAGEKALIGIASRGGEASVQAALDALNGANPATRLALLRVLAATGQPKALEAVLASLDDADETVRNEAAWALVASATELGKNPETKPLAVSTLNTVLAKNANTDVQQRAQEVLGNLK